MRKMLYTVIVRDLEAPAMTTRTTVVSTPADLGRAMGLVRIPTDRYVEISSEQLEPEVDIEWPTGTVFVAGMFTRGQLEAEIEDHDWYLEDEATPRLTLLTTDPDKEFFEELRVGMRALLAEESELQRDSDGENVEFLDLGWKYLPGNDFKPARRMLEAYMAPVKGGVPDGIIVVQAFRLDSWRAKERAPGTEE